MTPAAPISVLLAERQPLLGEAMARALRQRAAFRLVAAVTDGRAALRAIERHRPAVAVVDTALPGLDGQRVLNAVVRDGYRTRVMLLSPEAEGARVYDAIAAGAAGWISRSADARELCAAVLAAACGDVALARSAQTTLAGEIRRRAGGAEPLISAHERRVLDGVAAGQSTDEIARSLGVSTGSVKASLLRLYRRLGVSERAAAVAAAMRRGLIE